MSLISTRVHELFHAFADIQFSQCKPEDIAVCVTHNESGAKGYCGVVGEISYDVSPISLMAGIVHHELKEVIESVDDKAFFLSCLEEAQCVEGYNETRETILLVDYHANSLGEGSDHKRLLDKFPNINLEELLDDTLVWMKENLNLVFSFASSWDNIHEDLIKYMKKDLVTMDILNNLNNK